MNSTRASKTPIKSKPTNLLDQIRAGTTLKKASDRPPMKTSKPPVQSHENSLFAANAKRGAVIHGKQDDDTTATADEWNDDTDDDLPCPPRRIVAPRTPYNDSEYSYYSDYDE
jgi:hypothetical protein